MHQACTTTAGVICANCAWPQPKSYAPSRHDQSRRLMHQARMVTADIICTKRTQPQLTSYTQIAQARADIMRIKRMATADVIHAKRTRPQSTSYVPNMHQTCMTKAHIIRTKRAQPQPTSYAPRVHDHRELTSYAPYGISSHPGRYEGVHIPA